MISSRQLSIKINEVLNHLCVNDEMIKDRRKCLLQLECVDKLSTRIVYQPACHLDVFYFGSQSEGTTTLGLKSDIDIVHFQDKVVVITDKEDDKVSEDMLTFRMDKYTNKGYCCLRDISYFERTDALNVFQAQEYRRDNYLKNSFQMLETIPGLNTEREGPAVYYHANGQDNSYLIGICCTTWPREVSNTFLLNQEKLHWPSDQLLQDVLQSRCFVVPKGSDTGPDSDIEWRLSFSFGERLLMFDLNIVKLRCYVLMKYIKTTFLDNLQDCKGIISSYICKNVLFHTVSQIQESEWVEESLLHNFIKCLSNLQKFIDQKNCPHFIMPLKNLLENKLNEATQSRLLEELQRIKESNGHGLLDIKIDNFGELLNRRDNLNNFEQKYRIYQFLLDELICHLISINIPLKGFWIESVQTCEGKIKLLQQLHQNTSVSGENMHCVIKIFVGMYSTLIGSLLASDDIKYKHDISDKAFQWFLVGMMCTEKASAHLKLASILFLIGDFDFTVILLCGAMKKANEHHNVYTCNCKDYSTVISLDEIQSQSILKKTYTDIIRKHIANCVIYLPEEINCCPKELQYEFFRAAFNEIPPTDRLLQLSWLFLAVIPQEPYCRFLLYKLFKQLGMTEECNQALDTLTNDPKYEHLYLNHLETVYNLIGQCMEQEGRFHSALQYYCKSLQVEPTYNAAKILICCNLCQQLHLDEKS